MFVTAIPIDFGDDNATYFAKRSKRDNVVGSWKPCKVLKKVENIGNNKVYVVEFFNDRTKKDVASYELAKHMVPTDSELEKGTRVIALRRTEKLPYKLNEIGVKIELYSSDPREFYPGILAAFHTDGRYLVFFDDGMVQYVPKSHICRVLGNDAYNHGVCMILNFDTNNLSVFHCKFIFLCLQLIGMQNRILISI